MQVPDGAQVADALRRAIASQAKVQAAAQAAAAQLQAERQQQQQQAARVKP